MDRLEIAQKNYARIVPGRYQLDEQKSEELEAWLRDDVVPIVADLQRMPAFRRNVRFGLSRLAGQSDTPERLKVMAVPRHWSMPPERPSSIGTWPGRPSKTKTKRSNHSNTNDKTQNFEESWDITAKIAECPWFDFAIDLDFIFLTIKTISIWRPAIRLSKRPLTAFGHPFPSWGTGSHA